MVENEWVERLAGREGAVATDATPETLAIAAARAADSRLGRDTVVLSVGDVLAVTDYFVITHGGSDRQVKAIVDEVEVSIGRDFGLKPVRVEGIDTLSWVLMDYGSFVVHVFDEETRAFYDLERLWKDSARIDWKV